MKIKLKIIKITIIALVLSLAYQLASPAFLDNSTAFAVGSLTINWGVPSGNPIFVVTNYLPGQGEQRTVSITNNDTQTRHVAIQGIKTSETGNISQVIDFVISQNGTDIYGGTTGAKTLAQFFSVSNVGSGLSLGDINASVTKSFTFKATFKINSGNIYQLKSVVFDIKILKPGSVLGDCDNRDNNNHNEHDDKNNHNKDDDKDKNGHSSSLNSTIHQGSNNSDGRDCEHNDKDHRGGDNDHGDNGNHGGNDNHHSIFEDIKNKCISIFNSVVSRLPNGNQQSSKKH